MGAIDCHASHSFNCSAVRRLTIRSSRDRFAARLTRYRVPPRRAAALPGLTQVLGRMTKILAICMTVLATSACTTSQTVRSPLAVDLSVLSGSPEKFVGQRVKTSGCAKYHRHGAHISPCTEHTWREIFLIEDAANFSVSAEIEKAGFNHWKSPYADFFGVVVRSRSEIDPQKMVYTLVIDRVDKVAEHEP
jgi:hypothetical protein